jgi:large subunit ribosomal protein L6
MSRVGKKPVQLESGVTAVVEGTKIIIKGSKGQLDYTFLPGIGVEVGEKSIQVTRETDHRDHRSLHGLTRALIQNMVIGVSKGYEKKLEMSGVGYKAEVKQEQIILSVGFTNPKTLAIPSELKVLVDKSNKITVSGIRKEAVGEFAAQIRRVRPPEPYKGKGIKYDTERIVRKVGKTSA